MKRTPKNNSSNNMSPSDSASVDDVSKEAMIKRNAEATAAAAAAVDAAACRAIELVRKFADQDPSDGNTSNPWKNPADIYQQLDKAREDVLQAWDELHLLQEQKSRAEGRARLTTTESSTDAAAAAAGTSNEDDDLRAQFMDMVTDAFADVLNQMKESEEEIDVDVLVDCLQSGIDLLSVQDRELFFQDNSVNAMEEEEEDATNSTDKTNSAADESGIKANTLTPHEKRRRELGFHIETTV
jgi:hypothetical protein